VENHSQRHTHTFAFSGIGGFAQEIEAAQRTLANVSGRTPRLFRAPAGLRNPLLDPVLTRLELKLVSWSCRAFDTRSSSAGTVTRRLLRGVKPGAVLLMHDGHCARTASGVPVIVAVLPAVLDAAAARGLQWVTLCETLHAETS
jgi:peptidoglycan/xylan/chitin deacetylase (PgdA/CDA1 family)